MNNKNPKGCYFYERWLINPPFKKDTLNKNRKKDCKPNIGYVFMNNEKFYVTNNELKYKANISDSIENDNVIYNFTRTKYSERF